MYGQTTSPDFPLTTGPPPSPFGGRYTYVAKVYTSELLLSKLLADITQPSGMTVDAQNNILVTGTSFAADFPLTPGVAHGGTPPSASVQQAVLMKLNDAGNTIFATYFGGSIPATTPLFSNLDNFGVALATDDSGIYLAGNTSATDFATTPGAYQKTLGQGCSYPSSVVATGFARGGLDPRLSIFSYNFDDIFVLKLSPDGKNLIYSTLLGGSCYDRPTDIAVDSSGAVFVTGETNSVDFPVVHPFIPAPAMESYESFVSMLSPDGSGLPFSSYLFAGSAPKIALSDSLVRVAGDVGAGAQSVTFTPASPLAPPLTDASISSIDVTANRANLDLTGVRNGFSLLPGPIAAGEIVELTVPDLVPVQSINLGIKPKSPLTTSLAGVQVLFDGQPALIMAATAGKVICIAPQDFGDKQNTNVQVNFNRKLSNSLAVPIARAALGLLSSDGSGTGLANARNDDGTLNGPTNPAKRGSRVTIYVTGVGVPPAIIMTNYGSASVSPLSGAFVPGIYAVNFDTPSIELPSPISVFLTANNGVSSSQTLMVYVQ